MKSPAPRSTARRLAFVAALLAPALTACGFGAQTDQIYQAAQGSDDRSTSVKVLNAVIVASQDGSGTFAGTFVNESGQVQALSAVTGTGLTASDINALEVAPRSVLNLGQPATDADGEVAIGSKGEALPQLFLSGSAIEIGRFVELTFTFSGAGTVVLNTPVVSSDGALGNEFTDVPLPPGSTPIPVREEEETEAHSEGSEG